MKLQKILLLFFMVSFLQTTAHCAAAATPDDDSDVLSDVESEVIARAISTRDAKTLLSLLTAGLNPNKKVNLYKQQSMLDLALGYCKRHLTDFTQKLAKNRTESPTLIRDHFTASITLLLEAGANPNEKTQTMLYPLNVAWYLTTCASTSAIENLKLSIITSLLRKGANPRAFYTLPKFKKSESCVELNEDYNVPQTFFTCPKFSQTTPDRDIAKYVICHGAEPIHSFYGDAIKQELAAENKAHAVFKEVAAMSHPAVPDDISARIFAMLHGSLHISCFTEFYRHNSPKLSGCGCPVQ